MAVDQKNAQDKFKTELQKQFYDIVKCVLVTEKATRMIEFENKLVFEVAKSATKPMLRLLIEGQFSKPIKAINIYNNIRGKKRAIITFKGEGVASDLASELGLV